MANKQTLEALFNDVLVRYWPAQDVVIWETSGHIDEEEAKLNEEIKDLRDRWKEAMNG